MKNLPTIKTPKNIATIVAGKNAPNPILGFIELINAQRQYLQTKEMEKTKRVDIQKNAEVEITNIREKAQLLREYFSMSFSERRENFDRCLSMMDAGLSSGNEKQVDAALSLMVTIIQESPLKQAAEVMRQLKNRTDNEIIDI